MWSIAFGHCEWYNYEVCSLNSWSVWEERVSGETACWGGYLPLHYYDFSTENQWNFNRWNITSSACSVWIVSAPHSLKELCQSGNSPNMFKKLWWMQFAQPSSVCRPSGVQSCGRCWISGLKYQKCALYMCIHDICLDITLFPNIMMNYRCHD